MEEEARFSSRCSPTPPVRLSRRQQRSKLLPSNRKRLERAQPLAQLLQLLLQLLLADAAADTCVAAADSLISQADCFGLDLLKLLLQPLLA